MIRKLEIESMSSMNKLRRVAREMFFCLTWIQDLWNQHLCQANTHHSKRASFSNLPDDIIINILSRLSAETVVLCRLVCSQWLQLFSTPHFAEIHLARATPITLVQNIGLTRTSASDKIAMISIEDLGSSTKFREVCVDKLQTTMHKNQIQLLGSCNGLLLFEDFMSVQNVLLCNPITQEKAAMRIRGKFCGFFYDQSTKEYKLLLWYRTGGNNNMIHYCLHSLKTKERRNLGSSSYFPQHFDSPAAVVCGAVLFFVVLYRSKDGYDIPKCSKSIMMFDMDTEDFHVMPHPGAKCSSSSFESMHYQMRLFLEMNGRLSFTKLRANEIEVWILEDLLNWVWVRSYVVNLDQDFPHFQCYCSRPVSLSLVIRVCDIQNGELLLCIPFRGLFLCDPKSKTVRRIKTGYQIVRGYCNYVATKYTRSFVSLQQIL